MCPVFRRSDTAAPNYTDLPTLQQFTRNTLDSSADNYFTAVQISEQFPKQLLKVAISAFLEININLIK